MSGVRCRALCFTGGAAAGRAAAAAATRAASRSGRVAPPRLLLELGGCDAAYVRADVASVRDVAAALAAGAFHNAGQSCCGVARVYAHADVAQALVAALADAAAALRSGDPADPGTTLGPLARGAPAAAACAAAVADALAQGATLAFQGAPPSHAPAPPSPPSPPSRHAFFPATLLAGCDHAMRVMREEVFGPILAVQTVRSDGEAVALMNDSAFGLTASVFTADEAVALAILRRLVRAGAPLRRGAAARLVGGLGGGAGGRLRGARARARGG
jgi:acyl-CoA reductase-like NAD-dependent aldehyde dehydrogenase